MSSLRLALLLLIVTAACAPASRPDADGVLQHAKDAYTAGDFAKAAIRLEAARATAVGDPAAVELAWGYSALQIQQPLTALVHLHRAAFLRGGAGGQAQLESAIRSCERALDLQPGASEAPGGSTARGWGILAVAFLIQAGVLFGIARRRASGAALRLGVGSMVMLVMALAAVLGVYAATEISHADSPALVAQAGQRLCSEPHSATVFGPALRPGTGLRIQASSDRWCLVEAGEQLGWLPTESVASLAEPASARR